MVRAPLKTCYVSHRPQDVAGLLSVKWPLGIYHAVRESRRLVLRKLSAFNYCAGSRPQTRCRLICRRQISRQRARALQFRYVVRNRTIRWASLRDCVAALIDRSPPSADENLGKLARTFESAPAPFYLSSCRSCRLGTLQATMFRLLPVLEVFKAVTSSRCVAFSNYSRR